MEYRFQFIRHWILDNLVKTRVYSNPSRFFTKPNYEFAREPTSIRSGSKKAFVAEYQLRKINKEGNIFEITLGTKVLWAYLPLTILTSVRMEGAEEESTHFQFSFISQKGFEDKIFITPIWSLEFSDNKPKIHSFTIRMVQLLSDSSDNRLFSPIENSPISHFLRIINKTQFSHRNMLNALPDTELNMEICDPEMIDDSVRVTFEGTESTVHFCKCRLLFIEYFQKLFYGDFKIDTPHTIKVEMGRIALECFQKFVFSKVITVSQSELLLENYDALLELFYISDYFNFEILFVWCIALMDYMQYLPEIWHDFPRLWSYYIACRELAQVKGVALLIGKLEAFLCLLLQQHGETIFRDSIDIKDIRNKLAFQRIHHLSKKQFGIGGLVTSDRMIDPYLDEKNI